MDTILFIVLFFLVVLTSQFCWTNYKQVFIGPTTGPKRPQTFAPD